jgi:hypothetical protein
MKIEAKESEARRISQLSLKPGEEEIKKKGMIVVSGGDRMTEEKATTTKPAPRSIAGLAALLT